MEYERKSECGRKDFWLKMFEKANKNVDIPIASTSTFPIDKHVLMSRENKEELFNFQYEYVEDINI